MSELQQAASNQASGAQSADLINQLLEQENAKIEINFERQGQELDPVKDSIRALAKQWVAGKFIGKDVIKDINRAIAYMDELLSKQVNAVIHHPDFQKLEGAWMGLKHLVYNTPTDQKLKIRVMNISKDELSRQLDKFSAESGDRGWDQSPLFKRIFEKRLDTLGGEPIGCIVGDYQFSHKPDDVQLLGRIARISGAAMAPFIASASPAMLGLKNWQKLPDLASLENKVATPEYAAWRSLRQSEDARFVSLTLPRFLARLPYEPKRGDAFAFTEDMAPDAEVNPDSADGHGNYSWANAAYAMGTNIAASFATSGFCVAIRGVENGGLVEGLPIHAFPNDVGGIDEKCPTEIAISQRRENELSKLGFLPLLHYTGTDKGVFIGAQTIQQPTKYDDVKATENAELSARLPYVFMVSRFGHYLKKMLYHWVGSGKDLVGVQQELNDWISQYISDRSSADDVKARLPLADAKIVVAEVEGKPGFYTAEAFLQPHIQLEGVAVKLGVVARPPGAAK